MRRGGDDGLDLRNKTTELRRTERQDDRERRGPRFMYLLLRGELPAEDTTLLQSTLVPERVRDVHGAVADDVDILVVPVFLQDRFSGLEGSNLASRRENLLV